MVMLRQADAIGVNWQGYANPNVIGKDAFNRLSLDDKQWVFYKTSFLPQY